jgi:hypothetical protein
MKNNKNTKYMLKYKYFNHHYLSLILFCLSSIGFDLILQNYYDYFYHLYWQEISFLFIGFFAEGAYLCYIKYMIDIHYHHYWNITLSIGIMLIIINILTILIYIIIGKNSSLPDFIKYFWEYFKEVPLGIVVSKFIINFIFQFISSILEILTIFYLSPE